MSTAATGTTSTDCRWERLLTIGDLHGCRRQLRQLLAQLAPTSADRLILLGDYIDRGADSPGIIDDLLELRQRFPQTIFLRGNHEQMLLDYLAGNDRFGYLLNGGGTTLRQYRQRDHAGLPEHHLNFLRATLHSHQEAGYLCVHAGLKPGVPIATQQPHDLIWIRQEFISNPDPCEWNLVVVHGHTPQQEVSFTPCRIGLDTGAGYGRKLSGCDLLSRQVWQAA